MTRDDEPFMLTSGEKATPLWRKLSRQLDERLATLRQQNDADLTPEQTEKQRGRIAEVKRLLAYGADTPIIE